jgi:hypothetical protein
VVPSPDIREAAAADNMVHLSREDAVRRDLGGGNNAGVRVEVPKVEEVVREQIIEISRGFYVLRFQWARCKW